MLPNHSSFIAITAQPIAPRSRWGTVALLAVGGLALQAENGLAQVPDKRGWTLFNPTPREYLREMSTDRPDQIESPRTVDAGHFQVEMDFVNTTVDRDRSDGGDVWSEQWNIAPLNLKVGLLNNVDLQCVVDTFMQVRVEDRVAGTVERASGFGDVQTRLKINLWGNDQGTTALAVMPYVKWPLEKSDLRNGRTEGGVIVPFGMDLGRGWGLAAMTEFDVVANAAGGYDTEFVNAVALGRDLTKKLGMYGEFFTVMGTAPGFEWQGQADVGFTYALREDVVLDWGCNFGVTESAPDFNPFTGLSFRF